MPHGLPEAAAAARAHADTCIDKSCHAAANALTAAGRAFSDELMLRGLSEPSTPENAPPPWSQVSKPADEG